MTGVQTCALPISWDDFGVTHKKGDKVRGAIKSITDFGVFIGLAGNIDGLVHLSDLSWTESGEEAVRRFKKGDELEAIVLAIDVERERVSLFFGGWHGPFNILPQLSFMWFALKTSFFIMIFVLLRASIPRPRYDQVMDFSWKFCLPLTLINLLVTAAVVLAAQ